MAGVAKLTCAVLIVAALMAAFAPPCEAAIRCGQVVSLLNPCLPYVTGGGPLGGCCSGIKNLYAAAKSPADKQSVCGCLKSLAGATSGVNYGKAAGLPGTCGVSIPYKISPSTDCSKIK